MRWKVDFNGKRCKKERVFSGIAADALSGQIPIEEEVFVNDTHLLAGFDPQEDEFKVLSYVKVPDNHWTSVANLLYWAYPFGYMTFDGMATFLPDFLETNRSNLRVKQEGASVVLTTKSATWELTITLLSEKNYAAESIIAKRLIPGSSPLNRTFYEYRVVHWLHKENRWFPDQYAAKIVYPSGEYQTPPLSTSDTSIRMVKIDQRNISAKIEFSDISFPHNLTDDDLKISFPIPDYTEVHMQDAPQIKYVWFDGEIALWTDELALKRIKGHGFMPGTGGEWFSFLMAIAGTVMIVIALGILLWRYLHKNNNDNKKDEYQ
jgi:hypothetical protein